MSSEARDTANGRDLDSASLSWLEQPIPGLARRLVRFAGGWSTNGTRGFRGEILGDLPLTALLLSSAGGETLWAKAERPAPSPLVVELALFPYGPPTFEIQVSFGCHGAFLRRAVRRERNAPLPELQVPRRFATGEAVRVGEVTAEPRVTLHLLGLAGSDVETGRAGLWKLRPVARARVPEPWATVLSRRRIGSFLVPE